MIYCPKCGKKLDPNSGEVEKHELYDQTKDSGFQLSINVVCPENPDQEYNITADERV